MEARPIIFCAILSVILLACPVGFVYPQDGGEVGDFGFGHAEWHYWYNTGENGGPLMRPDSPSVKCCDNDCRPTKAIFKNDAWYVWVDRGWEIVPEGSIKRGLTPPSSLPHVCATRRTEMSRPRIYCFVFPEAGT